MAGFNGSGQFNFTYNWVNDSQNGVPITASRMDGQFNDAVSGFDLCLTRDNQGAMAANFAPSVDATYSLGTGSLRWLNAYLSGSLGVGVASPNYTIDSNGAINCGFGAGKGYFIGAGASGSFRLPAMQGLFDSGINADFLQISAPASQASGVAAYIKFVGGTYLSNTEWGRFGTDGSFLVGTTTTGGWANAIGEFKNSSNVLSAYSTGAVGAALLSRVDNTSAQLINFFSTTNNVGSVTTNGTIITVNGTSDQNLKNDLGDFDPGNLFDQIRVHKFTWKSNGEEGHSPFAQELNEIRPDLVQEGHGAPGDEGFRPWMVSSTGIIWDLVAEVKALRARVAALEAK